MDTIKLSAAWDLMVDAGGNIASLTDQSAIAQDAASAILTFQGECYYNTDLGIPYAMQVLGAEYAPAFIKSAVEEAAMLVPDVVQAQATLAGFADRKITGVVKVIDIAGQEINLHF